MNDCEGVMTVLLDRFPDDYTLPVRPTDFGPGRLRNSAPGRCREGPGDGFPIRFAAEPMGRYTGPKEKLSRREGEDLGLKGRRTLGGKGAMERRPYPPGQHGRGRRRSSEFSVRMRAKQRAKFMYGLREQQFAKLFDRANREEGMAGENLMRHLECRLDNVVYRLGLATTRAQARQFVVHQHVTVNGKRLDRPSYEVSAGDVVAIKPGAPIEDLARESTEMAGPTPPWLLADPDGLKGTVNRLPAREDISAPIEERLIVEHYSR